MKSAVIASRTPRPTSAAIRTAWRDSAAIATRVLIDAGPMVALLSATDLHPQLSQQVDSQVTTLR